MSNGAKENEVWNPENLIFYLSVYYSDKPDWMKQLAKLQRKGKPREMSRKHLAYTILSSYLLKVRTTDPPEALLFACFKFDSFDDLDWASKLEDIFDEDQLIKANRNRMMGSIISPVEYHSRSRQALKWLYEEASADPTVDESNKEMVLQRLRNSILLYGPSAICSLFQRPDIKSSFFMKAPNWRTGYFIERALYEHFSFEQLVQMKERDLESAPSELIKHFGEAEQSQSS